MRAVLFDEEIECGARDSYLSARHIVHTCSSFNSSSSERGLTEPFCFFTLDFSSAVGEASRVLAAGTLRALDGGGGGLDDGGGGLDDGGGGGGAPPTLAAVTATLGVYDIEM